MNKCRHVKAGRLFLLGVLAAGCTDSIATTDQTAPGAAAVSTVSATTSPVIAATAPVVVPATLPAASTTTTTVKSTSTSTPATKQSSTSSTAPEKSTTTTVPLPTCTSAESVQLASAQPGYQQPAAVVQQRLIDLGYKPGPADGFIGPQTMAALEAWSADAGMDTLPWNETTDSIDREVLTLLGVACPG